MADDIWSGIIGGAAGGGVAGMNDYENKWRICNVSIADGHERLLLCSPIELPWGGT